VSRDSSLCGFVVVLLVGVCRVGAKTWTVKTRVRRGVPASSHGRTKKNIVNTCVVHCLLIHTVCFAHTVAVWLSEIGT